MKIAHLIFSFNIGGAETMLVDIINEQTQNASIGLFIINNVLNEDLLNSVNKNIPISHMQRKPGSRNIIPLLRLNIRLYKYRPDVIHCHSEDAIKTLLPCFRRKSVLTIHDIGISTNDFNCYRQLFAISQSVEKDVEKRCGLKPVIVYNGVQVDTIRVKTHFNKTDYFRIILISRLVHQKKGQHLAIEAIKILRDKYQIKNIYLDFIGEGVSRDYLDTLVKSSGLENQIKFLGLRNREYIYSHLRDYDLLIQPSLYEGFGLTVVEGMIAKVPVLVSNTDGPMEIIDSDQYGYSFNSNDSSDLAKNILFIYNNNPNEIFHYKLEKSYQYALNKFDIKNTANIYLEEYRKLL